ncbi:T9SS type A sorting domain-containing protein [Flammeovirga aprica JL-4]|uniref:T9SS type A sorting domain-containing protein n=2 Tax=Flammeovirga aprica TaxID=29528 RepID=A0A7X9RXT6_9BACT|nr:T9SS type A sorting domain-containing protein [Flammeovirga aprica JL-4]
MKRNKLLRLSLLSFLLYYACTLNVLYAQGETCYTSIPAEIGYNTVKDSKGWYAFEVPNDMDTLIVSSVGLTSLKTLLYVQSECTGRSLFSSITVQGVDQSYLKANVKKFQGTTILINWILDNNVEGTFDWFLGGIDNHGKEYRYQVDIKDITLWHGEKVKPDNKYNTIYPLTFMIEGDDNGVIKINEEGYIEALQKEGTQEVVAVIFDDYNVNRGQNTFSITTKLDASGKKRGAIYDLKDTFVTNPGQRVMFHANTNSESTVVYSIISGGEYASISGSELIINDDDNTLDKEIIVEVSTEETDNFTSAKATTTIEISPYRNEIPYKQYYELVSIFNKNNGENWEKKEYWLTDVSVKEWFGIYTRLTVDEQGRNYQNITGLKFEDTNLNKEFEANFEHFSAITSLNFVDSKITGIPSSIVKLKNLNSLKIEGNKLTTLPIEITELVNLEWLYLEDNGLWSIPSEIGNLENLISLKLHGNYLTELPAEIGNLKKLTTLDVTFNSLYTLPDEIGNLTTLVNLSLRGNKLLELPSTFANLKALSDLRLQENRFMSFPLAITEITNLNFLRLSDNNIREIPAEIGNLINIRSLSLSNAGISQLPDEISNLRELQSLIITFNHFDALPISITKLESLNNLDIRYNNLRYDDLNINSVFLKGIDKFYYDAQGILDYDVVQDTTNATTTLSVDEQTEGNTYVWYKDDEVIEGENAPTLTFDYSVNFETEYKCRVINPDWPNLSFWSKVYIERGPLLKLIVKNIPDDSPEDAEIYAIGNLSEKHGIKYYPLVYNEVEKHYELDFPKNEDVEIFSFGYNQFDLYHEVNTEGELFERQINFDSTGESLVVDDIIAWNNTPPPSNYCSESIEIIEDSLMIVGNTPMWYKFTANTRMNITLTFSNAISGDIRTEYGFSCRKRSEYVRSFGDGHSLTRELLEGEEIYFQFFGGPTAHDAFNIKLTTEHLKTYVLNSIPEDTPSETMIYTSGDLGGYSLRPIEDSNALGLVLPERLEGKEFYLRLNKMDAFAEVDAQGNTVTRTVNPSEDTEFILDPVVAWKALPNPENSCDNPMILTESGNYIKGAGEQWYSYTAHDETQVTLSFENAKNSFSAYAYYGCEEKEFATASSYSDNKMTLKLVKGETVLFKIKEHRFNQDKYSFEWTFSAKVIHTYNVSSIPDNTPSHWKIYAVGDMNNYDVKNTDYPLTYIEEEGHYKLEIPIDFDTVNFSFVMENLWALRELNAEGDTVSRTIAVASTPNTTIDNIESWAPLYNLNSCEEAYEAKPGLNINTDKSVWHSYEASEDQHVTLFSEGKSKISSKFTVYNECGGNILYNSEYHAGIVAYSEFQLDKGEKILINWEEKYPSAYGLGKPHLWSMDTVHIKHQTISKFIQDFRVYGTYNLGAQIFRTDQEIPFDIEVVEGDAEINGSNELVINPGSEVTFSISNDGDKHHYPFDTVLVVQFEKKLQEIYYEHWISKITKTGKYTIPSNYTTNQGLTLNVEAVSKNTIIEEDTLIINAFGETQVRLFNEGDDTYQAFDSTLTFTVERNTLKAFDTKFFDDINETGAYFLPEFITEEGITLTATFMSGDGEIVEDSLILNSIGNYEIQLSSEETLMYEAFSIMVTIIVDRETPTSINSELSNSITLFPNPVKDEATLQLPSINGEVRLSIITSSGQVLRVDNITGKLLYKLDVSNLQSGVYILKINTENGIGSKRLIIK